MTRLCEEKGHQRLFTQTDFDTENLKAKGQIHQETSKKEATGLAPSGNKAYSKAIKK